MNEIKLNHDGKNAPENVAMRMIAQSQSYSMIGNACRLRTHIFLCVSACAVGTTAV